MNNTLVHIIFYKKNHKIDNSVTFKKLNEFYLLPLINLYKMNLNVHMLCVQMFVSVLSGPWDALFGGSNLPAFVVGGIAAAASGILAFTLLPSPAQSDIPAAKNGRSASFSASFH